VSELVERLKGHAELRDGMGDYYLPFGVRESVNLAVAELERLEAEVARLEKVRAFAVSENIRHAGLLGAAEEVLRGIAAGTVGTTETHYEAQRRHVKTARAFLNRKGEGG
jgi:hypothetical protein